MALGLLLMLTQNSVVKNNQVLVQMLHLGQPVQDQLVNTPKGVCPKVLATTRLLHCYLVTVQTCGPYLLSHDSVFVKIHRPQRYILQNVYFWVGLICQI